MTTLHDELASQREYLLHRLRDTYHVKDDELRQKFFIKEDDAPKTPQELIERIEAKKFRLRKADENVEGKDRYYDYPIRYFWWRTEDPDWVGYNAAQKVLDTDYKKLKDLIILKDPLEAYESLEKWQADTATKAKK